MRVMCQNCEGTGREYPYGERAMRCQGQGCSNGTVDADMRDFDGHIVRVLRGVWVGLKGAVAHVMDTWVVEDIDREWILVSPNPDDLEIVNE